MRSVFVDIPIFDARDRSVRRRVLRTVSGGKASSVGGGQRVIRVINDVTLDIAAGDRIGLVGSNGAGKSSLLRVLSGAYPPTSGSIYASGVVTSLIDISLGIDPEATGVENIALRAGLLGWDKGQLSGAISQIIDFSGLGDFIDLPVRTYSSGMLLRLAFSVATHFKPDVLLMDEWLSVGDETFKKKAESRLMQIIESSEVLVLASHSHELITKVCNRVIWLESGRVILDDRPEVVCEKYFSSVS